MSWCNERSIWNISRCFQESNVLSRAGCNMNINRMCSTSNAVMIMICCDILVSCNGVNAFYSSCFAYSTLYRHCNQIAVLEFLEIILEKRRHPECILTKDTFSSDKISIINGISCCSGHIYRNHSILTGTTEPRTSELRYAQLFLSFQKFLSDRQAMAVFSLLIMTYGLLHHRSIKINTAQDKI